jgi:hypothetical protein
MYIYPFLGRYDLGIVRLFGSGIGNLLFPWARAQILSRDYSLDIIEPTWPNLKIGSIIRGEFDNRFYFDLFCAQKNSISGAEKLITLISKKRISEFDFLRSSRLNSNSNIVVVKGVDDYFEKIKNEYIFVRQKLLEITLEKNKIGLSYDYTNSISVHVRLGDFKTGNITTPISWYMDVIHLFKDIINENIHVNIFSDGSNEELSPLLNIKNTKRCGFGSSIADLLALSNSKVLIGSRYSTFSMWASYLGQMPVVWPIDVNQKKIYVNDNEREIQSDGRKLSSKFIEHCISLDY